MRDRVDRLARALGQGHRAELVLTAFVALNLFGMLVWRSWETLPFHFIFASVTIVYGIRAWRTGATFLVIALVCLSTGVMTLLAVTRGSEAAAELFEVPLMTLIFVVMVCHVRIRQRAAMRLEAALEHEREFFANASHELLTPLTIARGSIELLGRSAPASSDQVDAARELVLQEIDSMERLVANLLTLGRLSVVGAPDRERVDAEELVETIAERWSRLDRRHWLIHLAARGTVTVDRAAIERAVDNLIENAFVHTRAGDSVALCTWSEADRLKIAVVDDGAGMQADVAGRVFERFYRTDPSRSRKTGGSGLGLSIVHEAVSAHDGSVALWTAPDEGTCVVLDVPCFERRAADRAADEWVDRIHTLAAGAQRARVAVAAGLA